jgi:hypothetical protein
MVYYYQEDCDDNMSFGDTTKAIQLPSSSLEGFQYNNDEEEDEDYDEDEDDNEDDNEEEGGIKKSCAVTYFYIFVLIICALISIYSMYQLSKNKKKQFKNKNKNILP